MLQLSSSSPTICPLKIRESDLSVHSLDSSVFPVPCNYPSHQGSNSCVFCGRAAETVFLWTNRSTLTPDMTAAHKHFCPYVVTGDQTSEVGHARLNPWPCLTQAHRQHLSNSTFFPFLPPLPTEVFPAPELSLLPQVWKKGPICSSSCRLQ